MKCFEVLEYLTCASLIAHIFWHLLKNNPASVSNRFRTMLIPGYTTCFKLRKENYLIIEQQVIKSLKATIREKINYSASDLSASNSVPIYYNFK